MIPGQPQFPNKPRDRLSTLRDTLDGKERTPGSGPPPPAYNQANGPANAIQKNPGMKAATGPSIQPYVPPQMATATTAQPAANASMVGQVQKTITVPTTVEQDQAAFIKGLMEDVNNVDTSAEEAQMREEMDRTMGQGLVNSRARAGAAGMATSGGQLAAEGGIRRDAAGQLSGDILDMEREAKQQAINNAFDSVSADIDLGKWGDEQLFNDEILKLLGDSDGGGLGLGDTDGNGIDDGLDQFNQQAAAQAAAEADAAGALESQGSVSAIEPGATTNKLIPSEKINATVADAPPDGTIYEDSDGEWNYYGDGQGTIYKVKVG